MDVQAASQADAIARSFSYVARQLAGTTITPVQYRQIHSEAFKHASALNLLWRDVAAHAGSALRNRSISEAQYRSACLGAEQAISKAKIEITRTLDAFAEYSLAA